MQNKTSNRYFSSQQEQTVAKLLGGNKTPNSGATDFVKGDVQVKDASLLVECKTCTTNKDSFSIKKEWLDKNLTEAKMNHLLNNMLAFNFGPDTKNYFIIDEKLAKYLVEKLKEEYMN